MVSESVTAAGVRCFGGFPVECQVALLPPVSGTFGLGMAMASLPAIAGQLGACLWPGWII